MYGIVAAWFVYSLSQLGVNRFSHLNTKSVFYLIMTFGFAILWTIFTLRRLVDLRLNRLWIIPFALPLVFVVMTLKRGPSIELGLVTVSALAVQLPLVLLPSRRNSESSKSEDSEGL
jgi:hypothetical protein